jgi:hypothetical protein
MSIADRVRRRLSPGWERRSARDITDTTRRLYRLERDVDRLNHTISGLLAPPPLSAGELERAEFRRYSQNGEDGILLRIFSVIATTDRRFVEIGSGDATECNTRNLWEAWGWSGLLIEGDAELAAAADAGTPERVTVRHCFVTAENIDQEIRSGGVSGEIDLLSIDIDGNDYWVWRAIESVSPRVVVIEYNAAFGPEVSATVPYVPHRVADFGRSLAERVYCGASLVSLVRLGADKGYALVGCDFAGVNAFFVRRDCLSEPLVEREPGSAWRPLLELLQNGHSQHQQQETLLEQPLIYI